MSSRSNTTIVSYVSSPHKGYLNFFRRYEGATLYVLGEELISEFPSLVKHLPGNTPEELVVMIRSLGIFKSVHILYRNTLPLLIRTSSEIVMPDEDVSHALAEKYFTNSGAITFDGSWRLRWDWGAVNAKHHPEGEQIVSLEKFDQEMALFGTLIALRSSDWWRQVGALLVKDGTVLLAAFNKHFPSEQSPYLYGDPRSNFGPGQSIEMSTALHAELGIITEAAKRGISMEGCDLYVTTFPCPTCAYACSSTGIKRLFYAEGYSLLEGAAALDSRDVQIVRVALSPPSST